MTTPHNSEQCAVSATMRDSRDSAPSCPLPIVPTAFPGTCAESTRTSSHELPSSSAPKSTDSIPSSWSLRAPGVGVGVSALARRRVNRVGHWAGQHLDKDTKLPGGSARLERGVPYGGLCATTPRTLPPAVPPAPPASRHKRSLSVRRRSVLGGQLQQMTQRTRTRSRRKRTRRTRRTRRARRTRRRRSCSAVWGVCGWWGGGGRGKAPMMSSRARTARPAGTSRQAPTDPAVPDIPAHLLVSAYLGANYWGQSTEKMVPFGRSRSTMPSA